MTTQPGGPTRVAGPTALGGDLGRFWRITWTLAVTQFRLRFYGSALGYLWQLMRPLMLFGVLYVVFTEFVRIGAGVDFYPVVLLTGIVLFTFVSEATSAGLGSLVERESLLRKVEFPRMAVPCATVLTALMTLGTNLLAVVLFAAISGVDLHASLVQVPLLLIVLTAFVLGVVLTTSALFVRYRDVKPIWEVLLQVLFYATPVLYPLEVVPEKVQGWLLVNPFAAVIQQTRHAALDPSAPSALDVAGPGRIVLALLIAFGLLALGLAVFRRRAPYVAEEL